MTTLWLTQELTGSILDVGGGGEGIIGRRYGSAVTVIDNRQEELDEAPCSGRAGRSLGEGTSLHHLRRCKIRPAIHGRFPEPVPGKRIDAFENGNRQRTFLSGISEIKNRRACFFQQTRL